MPLSAGARLGPYFLVNSGVEETGTSPFQILMNWTAGLRP